MELRNFKDAMSGKRKEYPGLRRKRTWRANGSCSKVIEVRGEGHSLSAQKGFPARRREHDEGGKKRTSATLKLMR